MDNPFETINEELKQLRGMVSQLLLAKNEIAPSTHGREYPVGIEQAEKILKLSRSSMYQNMAQIPHRKRNGRLYFFESELLNYINSGESVLGTKPTKSPLKPRKVGRKQAVGTV